MSARVSSSHLAAVGGELLGRLVQAVLPEEHVGEHTLAGAALAGGLRAEHPAQVLAVLLERRRGRGGRPVDGALAPDRGGEGARRVADQVEEPAGEVHAALDGGRGEAGLERLPRLRQQAGDGLEPAGDGGDAVVHRAELAHEQREDAGHHLEHGRGVPLRLARQLERAQPAPHHLQRRERVDGGAGVLRREQGPERALVRVEELHAPLARLGRPRRQAPGALREAQRRPQHRVVGDQVVQQLLHGERDPLALRARLTRRAPGHPDPSPVRPDCDRPTLPTRAARQQSGRLRRQYVTPGVC